MKFVASWSDYRNAIVMLAMSSKSDPALGNPLFVSAERISPALTPLSWFSTIPYLSIILSNFSPNRLVIDPAGNYFWLSCGTATRNKESWSFRCRPANWSGFIRAYIDKPGTTSYDSAETTNGQAPC